MRKTLILLMVGTLIRVVVAMSTDPLPHFEHYAQDAAIWRHGGNIYVEQTNYNYSPVQYHVLGMVGASADILGLPLTLAWRILFIVGDALIFLVLYRHNRRDALLFLFNPATIYFSAYLGSFETWAIIPLLYALWNADCNVLLMGILAVLIKQNVVFFVWTLYVYRYGLKRGLMAIVVTAFVFAVSFVPYLRDGYPAIWHNVIAYSGLAPYGFANYLTSPTPQLLCFVGMLLLPIFAKQSGLILAQGLQLSAIGYIALIYGSSSPMYMFPVYLATDVAILSAASVLAFMLYFPLTRPFSYMLVYLVGWMGSIGALGVTFILHLSTLFSAGKVEFSGRIKTSNQTYRTMKG